MSVIELPVTGDAVLRALELSAPENHPLCGSAVLSLGAEPSLRFEEGASSALTLSCGGGVKLSKNAARFRFVLPPEALSEGAELTLTDAEGGVMRCVLEAAPLERGGLLELPAVEYEQQEPPYLNQRTPGLYTISSKGKAAAIYVYEACRDQIAWIEGADALEWRLQCLEDGKVLRVRLPLQLGTAFDAVFSAIGVPASPDGKLRFSPVKSEDGLEWLVDASGKTLLILNTAL